MSFQSRLRFRLQFQGRIDETALESIMIRVGEYDSQEMTKVEDEEAEGEEKKTKKEKKNKKE